MRARLRLFDVVPLCKMRRSDAHGGERTGCSVFLSGIASDDTPSQSSQASTISSARAHSARLRDVLCRLHLAPFPSDLAARAPHTAHDEQEGSRSAAQDSPRSPEQQPQDGHRWCVHRPLTNAPPAAPAQLPDGCAQVCRTWASLRSSTFSPG